VTPTAAVLAGRELFGFVRTFSSRYGYGNTGKHWDGCHREPGQLGDREEYHGRHRREDPRHYRPEVPPRFPMGLVYVGHWTRHVYRMRLNTRDHARGAEILARSDAAAMLGGRGKHRREAA